MATLPPQQVIRGVTCHVTFMRGAPAPPDPVRCHIKQACADRYGYLDFLRYAWGAQMCNQFEGQTTVVLDQQTVRACPPRLLVCCNILVAVCATS